MCNGPHAFIPAPNAVKVVMQYATNGGLAENVYNVVGAAPATFSDLDAIISVFEAWESGSASHSRSSSVSLTNIIATALDSDTAPQLVHPVTPPIVGSATGLALPDNVTYALKMTSSTRGRSGQGRSFWVGLTIAFTVGDQIDPTQRTVLLSKMGDLQHSALVAGFPLAIVSYCHDNAWRTSAVVSEVVDITGDAYLDNMRKRLAGRGA
jgi:hypothetical protein